MKTTPDGLTHLINMLADVVNLQRKAQGTPGALAEVEMSMNEQDGRVAVRLYTEVNMLAEPMPAMAEVWNPGSPGPVTYPAAGVQR